LPPCQSASTDSAANTVSCRTALTPGTGKSLDSCCTSPALITPRNIVLGWCCWHAMPRTMHVNHDLHLTTAAPIILTQLTIHVHVKEEYGSQLFTGSSMPLRTVPPGLATVAALGEPRAAFYEPATGKPSSA
jgi:hypothetical protein